MTGQETIMVFEKLDVGDGITLARVRSEDAAEIFAVVDSCRDYLREWLRWVDSSRSVKDILAFVERSEKQYAEGKGFQACIRLNWKIVGVIGYVGVDRINQKTEIGYWIDEHHQGRGIVTKATRALTDYAFSEWNLNRVKISAGVENSRSRALAERLGFQFEGIARESEWVNGHFLDHARYAMLRRDWEVT